MKMDTWERIGRTLGIVGYTVPGMDIPTEMFARHNQTRFGSGVRTTARYGRPLGVIGAGLMVADLGMTYGPPADDFLDRSTKRMSDNIDIGGRLSLRHTHGYLVSPSNRMRRNPAMKPTVPTTVGGVVYLP